MSRMYGGPGGMGFNKMKFDDGTKPEITKEMLRRISAYFIPYWRQTAVVLVILLISSGLGVLPSIFIQHIVDDALPNKDMRLLLELVLISLAATVASGLIGVLQSYLNSYISQNIVYDMKNQMYRHLQKMPMQFYSNVKQGEVITRMTSDIAGIQGVFNSTVVNFASNLFILATTLGTLFVMNWKLAILGMCVVPLFLVPTRKMGRVRWNIAKQTQEKMSEQNHIIQETLSISGYLLMKLFTKEQKEFEGFQAVNAESTRLQIRESMAGRWFMMLLTTFTTIGPMLIYLYGGYLYIQGEITVGAIISFVALLGRVYGPFGQMTNLYVEINRSIALFERIFDYFDMEPVIVNKPEARDIDLAGADIVYEDVSFTYQKDKQALRHISFRAATGTMTALVGPSGAGKTTITNLLPRLYERQSGAIRIGGTDIRDMTLESLRSQIGLVTQDSYLFNGTIRENLMYANDEATEEEMIAACEAAYIHEFIMELPEGYDTVVGNRGMKLSGGEKQRIAIARVLLKDPAIIVMDEATSSLDTVSEYYIQKAMSLLLQNKTSIVIAHRLSTIMAADQILVVQDGTIVEEGRHEELLQLNGVYKDLHEKQFERHLLTDKEKWL
ncbi:ABC transporter ATP-binding protein [Paenibacillus glycanilyticus]|uniref:Multidrug ABC transporter ATPase n=1 Tax=Paenibacillus glycanilyticus TaxID=126569 RepID=A0ABQ6G627_9BACL|nr:ABC transporter ATP-binding protein [Paenibacillus glycanilyticus]GLX66444.1 multidrug ABC transporter ATPase [Paenibacillus glycanilyticus]